LRRDETKYRFYLFRQKDVERFFEMINPANEKYLKHLQAIRIVFHSTKKGFLGFVLSLIEVFLCVFFLFDGAFQFARVILE